MPITKDKFRKQFEKALVRYSQLKDMGKAESEIERILVGEKYLASVLSKLLHKSGKCLVRKVEAEDLGLAEKTFAEREDSRKPVRQKEIEDAAWYHNLIHDVGKYVFARLVKFVQWSDEDMNDYESARDKLTGFIDSIHGIIEDSGKVQRLDDEKTYLEMMSLGYKHVLEVAVKRVQMLSWYNDVLISCMTPESRLRALKQMMVVIAMKTEPWS